MDALAAREAYLYGYYGIPDKLLSRHPLFYTSLPDARQQEIYEIGKQARDRSIETKWQRMQQKKNAAVLMETDEIAGFDEETVRTEADAAAEFGEENFDTAADTAAFEKADRDAMDEWLFADAKSPDSFSADSRDKLTKIIRNGTIKLQRGFMCFPENDPLIENLKRVVPKEGFYDVAMHGSPTAVGFGTEEANMPPRLLANIIRHRADYHGENIRLLSCNTGYVQGDDFCFAEELANAMSVIVEAPNKPIYIYPNGTIKIGWLGEGKMTTYKPNGRGRVGARKEDKK